MPVGRIAGVFGVHGELKCDPTSSGRSLFDNGAQLELRCAGGVRRDVTIESVREHKGRLLIRLHGVGNADDAQAIAGATFFADRSRIELEAGEYLDRDLAGCALIDESGAILGTVERVEHYPASDMLVVNGRLVPMVAAFIKSVDTASKRIVADLPPGLLSDEDSV